MRTHFEKRQGPSSPRTPYVSLTLAVTMVALLLADCRQQRPDLIRRLASAAPRTARGIEARLSGGFPWTPLRTKTRGSGSSHDDGVSRFAAAVRDVIDQTATDQSAEGRHAFAVAQLHAGHPFAALEALDHIDVRARTAAIWNDIAATESTIANHYEAPEHQKDALAAADAALRISPDAPEALFNRAMTVERIGIREAARNSWRRFVAKESDPHWAREGIEHLQRLDEPAKTFRAQLDRSYDAIAGGDQAAASALTISFPQEARTWGDAEIMPRWAEAMLRGDSIAAARHLAIARALGQMLHTQHGERLLSAVVADVDGAAEEQRRRYAKAFVIYRAARVAYSKDQPGKAEPMLRDAASQFEGVGSPMSLVARYYVANTLFDQSRTEEARSELSRVTGAAPEDFKGLHAQLLWESGLCEYAVGRYQGAGSSFAQSAGIFRDLGETRNTAFLHTLLGDVDEIVGDFRSAWRERLFAIAELSSVGDDVRFRGALSGATRTAMLQHDWRGAASLADLEIEAAPVHAPDPLFIDALLRRAVIALRMGDVQKAGGYRATAASSLSAIPDPSLRKRLDADLSLATALLSEGEAPSEAIDALTKAAAFHAQKGRRMFVPEILRARSHAYLAIGDRGSAWRDIESAIEDLETQRDASPGGYGRSGFFESSRDLFTDAVALRIDEGDNRVALAYADRFRARVLMDSDERQPAFQKAMAFQTIPQDVAIVEYVVFPDRLITFVADRNGVRHAVVPISQRLLQDETTSFEHAIGQSDSVETRRIGAALYGQLVQPIVSLVTNATTLIIVPDGPLQQLPFSALFNPSSQQYLVAERGVIVSPSASFYVSAVARQHDRLRFGQVRLLTVADPRRDDNERLENALREATAIGSLYPSATTLGGEKATVKAFLQAVAGADVVHFAGHAVAPRSGPDAALLFAGTGDAGRLNANDVSALTLRRTRIVVLAGCSTAAGEVRGGEGSWSMAHGFLAAGVPTVIATLWPIDDALAYDVFLRIHEHLRKGLPPAEAVRRSQIDSIQRGLPVGLWAGVQIIGS